MRYDLKSLGKEGYKFNNAIKCIQKPKSCDIYSNVDSDFKNALDKNPHLMIYMHKLKKEEVESLQYHVQLSRDMKDLPRPNIIYPVGDPIFIHIKKNGHERAMYIPIEPFIPSSGASIIREIESRMALIIDERYDFEKAEEQLKLLKKLLRKILIIDNSIKGFGRYDTRGSKVAVNKDTFDAVEYLMIRDKVGSGILEPMIRDRYIEDISIPGVGPVFVEHKVFMSCESTITFKNDEDLADFVKWLGEKIGRPVTQRRPIVDGSLPDGSRVNIVYGSDISLRGSNVTIRKFTPIPLSIVELCKYNTMDYMCASYLWLLLESGMNVWICGETASGKTTTLKSLLCFLPPHFKIVSIEDTPEVYVPHENWVREVTRQAGESHYSVELFDLLIAALRQRPNYIVVGEIRGREGSVAFQAMQSVAGETPVLVKEHGKARLTTIADIVDKHYEEDEELMPKHVKDLEILSVDNSMKVRFMPVKYVLRHKADEIYTIKYEGGLVRATGSHSVFIINDEGDVIPKRVSDLRKGDMLVSFIGSSIKGGDERVSLLQLDRGFEPVLVSYMADGRIQASFNSKPYCRTTYSSGKLEEVASLDNVTKFYSKSLFHDKNLITIFADMYGHKLKESKLPLFIWDGKKEGIRSLLKGLKTSVYRRWGNSNFVSYHSDKPELVCLLLWLARLNGLPSSITEKKGRYKRVLVLRPKNIGRNSQKIPLAPLRKLMEILKPSYIPSCFKCLFNRRKRMVTKHIARNVLEWIVNNRCTGFSEEVNKIIKNIRLIIEGDIVACKVLSVKKDSFRGYVYDVSVPGSEAFFGGEAPILLHNTGHGVLTTFHAGNMGKLIQRLTGSPIEIPKTYIDNLNCAIIQSAVRIPKTGKVERRVLSINEIVGYDSVEDRFNFVELFRWDPAEDMFEFKGEGASYLLEEKIAPMRGVARRNMRAIYREVWKRAELLKLAHKLGATNYYDVWKLVKYVYKFGVDHALNLMKKGEKVWEDAG